MINALISKVANEKVNVYRFTESTSSTKGGTIRVPSLIKSNVSMAIQTSGSVHSVGGQAIINNIQGNKQKSVFIVYSPSLSLVAKDLIVREDNVIYEVQQVENNGKGTILHHEKYYIVEYENQKVLTQNV